MINKHFKDMFLTHIFLSKIFKLLSYTYTAIILNINWNSTKVMQRMIPGLMNQKKLYMIR